uniref:Ig-like domain-containing protein n=1 Tax=Oreochromis aureus TaxID=47969 RepID=A0A668V9Z3_OREAU
MGHSLLCMMGFFLLSTVICGNAEDNTTHSQDADKSEEEQPTSAPPKPTVTLQPSWTQICRGETVTVRCGGEEAQWTYEWRRDQVNISETSSEYRISRATESDSGGYSCRGRRGSSWTEWSDVTTLTVLSPPKITVFLQSSWTQIYSLVINSSETVIVRCEIQGGEGAQWTYEWRRDQVNISETSSEYRINRVTESDSGGYSCRGRRGSSWTEWSDNITLTVLSPPKLTVTLQPSMTQIYSGVIYSGETVTVRCEIQGGEGAQWTYEWRPDKLNTPPTSNNYRSITVTESVRGAYSCRGRRGSFYTEWSKSITLTVSSPPKPTVTLQPSWTQIYSGETVTVRCEIQGGEGAQWTYEWRPDKLNTPPTSNNYRIITVTESDSGGYSCRGRRGSFNTQWSKSITLTVSSPPKPTVFLQPSWTQIYRGETVTVRCQIQGGEGAQWTYEWRQGQKNIRETSNEYRIISATESDSGGYRCGGRRSSSWTEWSDITTLTVLSPPKPTVTLQSSRTQIYSGDRVTVRCEIQGVERAQWTYEWRRGQSSIHPTSNVYTITVTESDGGGYSCRGRRSSSWTEWSDITTLRVTVPIKPTVTLQPSWTQIYSGETVTVRCEIQGGEGAQWTYEWRAAKLNTRPTSNEYRITVTQSDSGGYSCRGRRDYSLTEWSETITLTVSYVHSAASLTVSPDRVQHFTSDSVSLTCEGNFTEWRVRKFSEDGRLYSDCRRMTGSTCNIKTSKSDTGVYWCESGSGEFSSAVNITVQNDGNVPILVSPVHPVTEGASVSLSCSLKRKKILSNVFFYHNDKLIQNDTRGELKISAVSKSDEGFYKCQSSGRESAQSWMSVKITGRSSSPVWLMVGLVCGVSLIIILLLLLYRCRQSKC